MPQTMPPRPSAADSPDPSGPLTAATQEDRPLWPAVRRGLACRCPNCGQGRILEGYLTVRPACPVCGEDLTPQRADDGPAYLTILVVGHILAPVMIAYYTMARPEPLEMILVLGLLCAVLTGVLLPRFKGMLVAIQWSRRMHGFEARPLS